MTSTLRASFAVLLVFVLTAFSGLGCKSEPPKPGQKEFEAANDKISTFSSEVGFGSDAAATALAKKMADRLKKLEAETFEGGKDAEKDFMTKGNFLTYCHTQGNDIVFLVQAPNLDTYEGDVRKGLFEIAWQAAQEVTGKPAGKNLVIGLRGKLLYGVMGKGKAGGAAPNPAMGTSIEVSELYPHFAGAASAPAATAQSSAK